MHITFNYDMQPDLTNLKNKSTRIDNIYLMCDDNVGLVYFSEIHKLMLKFW